MSHCIVTLHHIFASSHGIIFAWHRIIVAWHRLITLLHRIVALSHRRIFSSSHRIVSLHHIVGLDSKVAHHIAIFLLGTGSHIVVKLLFLYLLYSKSCCQFRRLLSIDRLAHDNATEHDLNRLFIPVTHARRHGTVSFSMAVCHGIFTP